ncbi:hypothetical protein PF008_g8977 [Phytophthora fragariae]|uniref:Retrotransposon gag domain-containing protein n=1 Tax=Phytophthora fragariae TaxID=53985 RepID=A0A6G0RYJ8_9STRA|nr:hypothetical protein PF008_g8977 [Phytophthora fragariae]
MAASFEGEALLWYDTVEDSFDSRQGQTFANLSNLMKDLYMVTRSNPEVVARLRLRKQQRDEPLVEYAQKLREIASSNPVDEEWMLDAFLSGLSNSWSATLFRGHKPATLNAAVNAALDEVGEYIEGYGVGLGVAMAQHNRRVVAAGHTPVATMNVGGMQLFRSGDLGSVLTGYEGFVIAAGEPTRYGAEGRLVVVRNKAQTGQWNSPVIPMGTNSCL